MQSKFWGDDSDDSYSDSSEYSSQAEGHDSPKKNVAATNWALSDSSSDEEGRIVKSAKAKALEIIQGYYKTMQHHMKINDFSELLKDYDSLSKLIDKQYSATRLPKLIVQAVVELGKYLEMQQKDKESYKKFSKAKSIAFNTMRARLRKFNENHSEILQEYNEDPDNFEDILQETEVEYSSDEQDNDSDYDYSEEEEEDKDDEDQEDEDQESQDSDSEYESSKRNEDGESDDYTDWSDSGVSDVSDGDTTDKHKSALAKWGVKQEDDKSKKLKTKPAKKPKTKAAKKKGEREKPIITAPGMGMFTSVAACAELLYPIINNLDLSNQEDPFNVDIPEIKEVLKTIHLTADAITVFLKSILERRGKKDTNMHENMKILQTLPFITKVMSFSLYVNVVETLIHLKFDYYSYAYGAMSPKQWIDTYKIIAHLITQMVQRPDFLKDADPHHPDSDFRRYINTLSSIIQKLNDELYKGLLYTDVDNDDYKVMLVYTVDMLFLLHKTLVFYIKYGKETYNQVATSALLILDHVYYKADNIAEKIWDLIKQKVKDQSQLKVYFPNENYKPSQVVADLVQLVFKHGTYREKVRACLHWAFNKSLHGLYYEARDLLATPNLQELANDSDVSIQILLNRNLAQLGICAFRLGLIHEAHSYLSDLCSQNRHKELLAQGISMAKNQDKPAEQERAEKRRLLPYHMHISIELIESINNICALLLETANIARSSLNHREIVSRHFRRMFEMHEKQAFIGPPENNRDMIVVAFKHLQNGNWKECFNYLACLGTWNYMPEKEKVQAILLEKIKTEAFRTYIFKYVNIYDSFSVEQLSSMFDLDPNIIHSLISKMIINGEIHGSWDDSSKCCLINHTEPTDLQKLAIKLAENLTTAE
ncbi:bifunctional Proteasome component (PCI) domain/Eukaryotic translation initiation factor 3 subunit C/Eukaryotic translation initiation factor 3 subunit C [Babesia duncani]|uniref:Eukaryotic translation initiation factor 3 subunit C n=1 Tax=Babesia duncani TaxID=323732 RepID=A0AAD9UP07_9APIC|nr:bifunctional Proteasome component (PCI) domain/Eukaryotic translation initiation factor 3 subunit C/Eukaryotic translation initiation factor 3 subunit C [Babesia duncani]